MKSTTIQRVTLRPTRMPNTQTLLVEVLCGAGVLVLTAVFLAV